MHRIRGRILAGTGSILFIITMEPHLIAWTTEAYGYSTSNRNDEYEAIPSSGSDSIVAISVVHAITDRIHAIF